MIVLPGWLHMAALLAVVAFALVKGGRDERFAALCLLAAPAVNAATQPFAGLYAGTTYVVFDLLVDGTLALLFTGLALRSTRYWTIALAAVALILPALEIAHLVRPLSRWTYGTAGLLFWYLCLLVIAGGVGQTWRARRRAA